MKNIFDLSNENLTYLSEEIQLQLNKNSGIGIGESSVLSKKIHLYKASSPQNIQIVVNADAGKFFYGQIIENKIFHLDVFHQCGKVNHHQAAKKVIETIKSYGKYSLQKANLPNPDLFDIQTGTGGGRITGSLTYGTKESLCYTHQNHIHLAFSLSHEHLVLLFYLVETLEKVILNHKLELRQIEQISNGYSDDNQYMNVSDYADKNDSALRRETTSDTTFAMKELKKSSSPSMGDETLSGQDQQASSASTTGQKSQQQTLLGLLRQIPHTSNLIKTTKSKKFPLPQSLHNLIWRIRNYLKKKPGQHHPIKNIQNVKSIVSKQISKSSTANDFSLDISTTIHNAAVRQLNQYKKNFSIQVDDLAFYSTNSKTNAEICLLLDASASMGGWRIDTAKELIFKLREITSHKISIITFHNQNATIALPFTRDKNKLIDTLNQLQPSGATPLALGFKISLQYLKTERLRKPFLFLITDGLPCYTSGNLNNPLEDALLMAKEIKKHHIHFSCIGLNETQDYLHALAKAGEGHVFKLN